MPARVRTVSLEGVHARGVEVEVDLAAGLPTLNVVGLPEAAVREARDRVRAALANSGYQLPARRITINLAPADLPKEGSGYDLPMALGLLAAMERIPAAALEGWTVLGELALDGRLKPVPGALPAALHAQKEGLAGVILPRDNGEEAALARGVRVLAPETLLDLCRHLVGEKELPLQPVTDWEAWGRTVAPTGRIPPDMAEVKGQEHVKRALEIAASGGHNLILSGPPGCGKTLLARAFPGILPRLSLEQALEVAAVYSVSGLLSRGHFWMSRRPFRAPHHTASHVALIGGGNSPRPGEVSLAHHGVLFLDELPEFERRTLEVLREPLESGEVVISRAARSSHFPARFQLISACNPCPCGHAGNPVRACRCSPNQVENYRGRLSGPLLDRIDLYVDVPPVPHEELVALPGGETSEVVRARVTATRARQGERQGEGRLNAHLEGRQIDEHVVLDQACRELLLAASRKLDFSARGYHRILRVARTVADLAGEERVSTAHLAEAIHFRIGGRFLKGG